MIRIGVVSLGCPHHAKIFVSNMNANSKHYRFSFLEPTKEYGWSHINPEEIDVLWFYGFHALPDSLISKFKQENPKLKVVVTWVGSDILEFFNLISRRPQCKDCIIKNVDVHVADGLNLVKELAEVGIKASYIPSIPTKAYEFTPLPETFMVAAYVPWFRAEFFNYPLIREVATRMPDVQFNLFGGGPVPTVEPQTPNMFYRGWVEGEVKDKYWKESSVLLYMPIHGSLGVTAVEFLQLGRWVICSAEEYLHVFKCSTPDELHSCLSNLKTKKEIPEFHSSQGNIEGSKFYTSEFSAEKQAEKVNKILDAL